MSATRSVVSTEILSLPLNTKDTIPNLNYKILKAGEDAFTWPNALTENQVRHAMLMQTRACDKGSFLLFEVLLEELSSIWYYIVANQSRNKTTGIKLELACN